MTSAKDLKQISPLLEAVHKAEEAKLARITKAEIRLRAQLEELQKARQLSVQDRPVESDAARRAGADVVWQTWIDQRRAEINFELAQLAAKKPAAIAALKLAFGRKDAIRQMTKRVKRDELLRNKRRSY